MTPRDIEILSKVMLTISTEGRAAIWARVADAWDEGRETPSLHGANPYRKD